jgi:FkbM family methyltransferase
VTPPGRDIEALLRRAKQTLTVVDRVSKLERELQSDFPLQDWWERSHWEPTVAHAIRDHCRSGDTVFDVGANAGGLSQLMSRLVGPKGLVCAFEASPRIVGKTQHNLVKTGCFNVTLYHKAVWSASREIVNMAAGSHLNDRIEKGLTGMPVPTVALDDFVRETDLRPTFIKMDIEGAEYEALKGMAEMLQDTRPVLVLEQSPADMRCNDLLSRASYVGVDLASYRRVRNSRDFAEGTTVANVLFVPGESADHNPYFSPEEPELVAELPAEQFSRSERRICLDKPLSLPPGRYIIEANFSAEGTGNEVFAGVEANGEMIFRYHTYTHFLAQSYRHWVIHLDRSAAITPVIRFLRGSDSTLQWHGTTVHRLTAFDGVRSPLVL